MSIIEYSLEVLALLFSALLGNPIKHSVSHYMFNSFAQSLNMEYSHIKLNVENEYDLPNYMNSLREIGCCGFNVTLPYKRTILDYCDFVDSTARKIGAVNTVAIRDNKFYGYNTDAKGAYLAIKSQLKEVKPKDKVVLIGSGGAARAIIYELYSRTDNIIIIVRNVVEAQEVISDFKQKNRAPIKIKHFEDPCIFNDLLEATFLVNATPVGMHPYTCESPLTIDLFTKVLEERSGRELYVFDVIFNPYLTSMLQVAKQHGAKTCSGLWMMINQGLEAFKLWTNKEVPINSIQNIHEDLKGIIANNYSIYEKRRLTNLD